jgi:hypothetical protein
MAATVPLLKIGQSVAKTGGSVMVTYDAHLFSSLVISDENLGAEKIYVSLELFI